MSDLEIRLKAKEQKIKELEDLKAKTIDKLRANLIKLRGIPITAVKDILLEQEELTELLINTEAGLKVYYTAYPHRD